MALTLKELQREMARLVREAAGAKTMRAVTTAVQKEVIDRTKEGKGVNIDGGVEKSLPKLADVTVKVREWSNERGRLAADTTPSTSNLTRSGRMLKSTKVVAKKGIGEVRIKGKKNNAKATALLKVKSRQYGIRHFKWLAMTKKQIDRTTRNVQKLVDLAIKRLNNK